MSASSPGTGSLDLEKRVGELEENTSTNAFGQMYQLTHDTEYTCPTDGYFLVHCSAKTASSTKGYINDVLFIGISAPSNQNSASALYSSCFIKKGMKIKYTGAQQENSNAYFYPLINKGE